MNYWQVAAGEGARDYSSVFLQYGVMLIGAGDPGHYFEKKAYYKGHRDWRAQVVRFAERVSKDDLVILKRPSGRQWRILAVGRVTGDYEYLQQFDDVEGWDLQHCRRVQWVCPSGTKLIKGLSRGTFIGVNSKEAIDAAQKLLEEGRTQETRVIPPVAPALSDEDLVESLIENGLRPADSERVVETIWRVRLLGRWYAHHGQDLSEDETRTFLVIPLLLALGWSEQRIKVEWRNIDIALFEEVYKRGSAPCMIIECKRMGEGLRYAEGQAKKYAELYPMCSRLVVSDGLCYRLYEREDNSWVWKGYMNLLKLKDRHPYDAHIEGATHLFIRLMPK